MLKKLYDSAQMYLVIIGGAAVILMMALIDLSVIAKNTLGSPIPLTSVIVSNFFMILIVFLPLGYAQRRRQHITVDSLYLALPPGPKRIIEIISILFTAVCAALIAVQSLSEALKQARVGTVVVEQGINVPVWTSVFVLPIGFLFFAIAAVLSLRRDRD